MAVGPFEAKTEEVKDFQVGIHDSYDEGMEGSAPTYQPLYYTIPEVNVTGSGTVAHPMKGLDYGPILEYSDDEKIDLDFTIDGSPISLTEIPLITREVHHHAVNQY